MVGCQATKHQAVMSSYKIGQAKVVFASTSREQHNNTLNSPSLQLTSNSL